MPDCNPFCPKCKTNQHVYIMPEHALSFIYKCEACSTEFIVKPDPRKEVYIITRDPKNYSSGEIASPTKTFESFDQACTVAEKLAREHNRPFYVAKMILKFTPKTVITVKAENV